MRGLGVRTAVAGDTHDGENKAYGGGGGGGCGEAGKETK